MKLTGKVLSGICFIIVILVVAIPSYAASKGDKNRRDAHVYSEKYENSLKASVKTGANAVSNGSTRNNSGTSTATADVWGPMIDNYTQGSADRWYAATDDSGTVSVMVYSGDMNLTAKLMGSVGSDSISVSEGAYGTVKLSGLSPGEVVRLDVTYNSGSYHYRPKFSGVNYVYIGEDTNSPNDYTGDSSDLELGFDSRWASLPNQFADTSWYYYISTEKTFTWQIKNGWPAGAGVKKVELFNSTGALNSTLTIGTSTFGPVGFNVSNPATGWWRAKVTPSKPIEPYAQHYLMESNLDKHYLKSGSFVAPPTYNSANKNQGSTKQPEATKGEPVNIVNGNMYILKTDISNPAPGMSFDFTRTYNSLEETEGPMGVGWAHSFNVELTPPQDDTTSAIINDADGRIVTFFQDSPSVFLPMTGDYSTLTKTDAGFTWKKKEKITYSFNSQGTLQSIKDKNGNAFSFSYNSQGRLITITDTAGRSYTITYDDSGRITRIEDATGRKVSYEYDSNGNLIKTTDAGNVVTVYEYDDANDVHNITKQTVDNKFVYVYAYDENDQCVYSMGQSGDLGFSFEYKTNEAKTVVTDSKGNITNNYYDSDGNITKIVHPDNSEESFTFDENLNKTVTRLQDGNTWQYEYDNNGNVTKVIDPFGNQKVMAYDNDDNLTSLTDELGRITNYSYDSNGNLTKITYPDETYTTFTYNSRGQPLTITDMLGKATTFAYDTQENLTSATDPEGNIITYAYDSLGRRTSVTDKRGNVTKYQYDALNRVIKVTDAKNGEVNTTHTIAGIGSLKDQNSNTTAFQYDSLNQLTGVTDPLSKAKQFSYDANGNLDSRVDYNGNSTSYTYDSLNRLTAVNHPDSSQIDYSYDSMGRLTQMTDAAGTSKYTYDTVGRITSYTNGQGQSVSYAYDKAGNLTSLTYPGSKTVTYTYDSQNRLTKVSDWSGRETLYSYDRRGLLTKATLPNSTTAQYEYDNAGRITTLKNLKSDGSVIATYSYTLDKNGNIVYETVNQPLSPVIQSQSVNYTYSSDNRLLSGGDTSFTHDQNGNLTAKGGTTYKYDYENRLKKVATPQGAWEYEYDGHGNRIGIKTIGETKRFLLDTTGITYVLAEYDGNSNLIASYIYGIGLVYRVDTSDNPYYYHYNFTGSTVAMSDASGNVVNKYAYTPFGALVSSNETVSNPFRYVGKFGVMDDENGLFYMRARYYDPEVGRFITKDPIGFSGGVNLYGYVENNPINYSDYLGLCKSMTLKELEMEAQRMVSGKKGTSLAKEEQQRLNEILSEIENRTEWGKDEIIPVPINEDPFFNLFALKFPHASTIKEPIHYGISYGPMHIVHYGVTQGGEAHIGLLPAIGKGINKALIHFYKNRMYIHAGKGLTVK